MSKRDKARSVASGLWKGAKLGLKFGIDVTDGLSVPFVRGALNAAQRIIDMAEARHNTGYAIGVNQKDCQQLKDHGEQVKIIVTEASTRSHPAGSASGPLPKDLSDKMSNLTAALEDIAKKLGDLNAKAQTKRGRFSQHVGAFFTTADVAAIIKECNIKLEREIKVLEVGLGVDTALRVVDVQQRQERIEQIQMSESDEAKLKELHPAEHAGYRTRRPTARRRCMEGTRKTFLRDIQIDLKNTSMDAPRIVWLRGPAGTGKSTVSQTICEDMDTAGSLGASFFCSRTGEATLSDPGGVLPTIAFQLARFDPDFRRGVIDALKKDPAIRLAAYNLQLDELILAPLRLVRPEARPLVLIVLDALDECEKTSTKELLAVLVTAASHFPSHVKILITSRPEFHLRSILESASLVPPTPSDSAGVAVPNPSPPVLIHDIDSAANVKSDIRAYLEAELKKVSCPEVQFSVSETDLDELATRCGTVFIIAATYVRFIGDEELGDPMGRLKKIVDSLTPSIPDLDDLYSDVLTTATPTRYEAEHFTRLKRVLGMVVLLREELSIAEMERLGGRDLKRGDVRIALRLLHSVVSVPPSDVEGSPHILHPSFADFLCDEARCINKNFFLNTEEHHTTLAIACFDRLADSLTCRFPHHIDPDVANTEVEGLTEKISSTFPSEVPYTCRNWASHLSGATAGDSHLTENLQEFLRKRLIWWMEVMSLLGDMDRAVDAVVIAQRWTSLALVSATITDLLNDAYRLLLAHLPIITRSAPQLYRSVLLFTPTSTTLYDTYHHMADTNVQVLTGLDAGWSRYLAVLAGHAEDVECLAFSQDSKLLASASIGEVRIWNGSTGAAVAKMRWSSGIDDSPRSLSFSPDASRITLISSDAVNLWEVATASLIKTLTNPRRLPPPDPHVMFPRDRRWVELASLSPDWQRLAVVFAVSRKPMKTFLYNWMTGDLIGELPDPDGRSEGGFSTIHRNPILNFSPDSKRLAYIRKNGSACLWDAVTGQFTVELYGHRGTVGFISFSPDSQRLVTASSYWSRFRDSQDTVTSCLWNSVTNQLIKHLEGVASSESFSPNSRQLATESDDERIHLWKATDGTLIATLSSPNRYRIRSWAFSPDSRILACWSGDGAVSLFDGATGKPITTLPSIGSYPCLMFIPGDTLRLLQCSAEKFRLWDTSSNLEFHITEWANQSGSTEFTVSPSKKLIISLVSQCPPSPIREESPILPMWGLPSPVRSTYLWESESGACLELHGPAKVWRHFSFSPDSQRIASCHRHEIRLWDTAVGRALSERRGPLDAVATIKFSRDGRLLAVASWNGSVVLFNPTNGASTPTSASHSKRVCSLKFSPDSRTLASACDDGKIWLCDTEKGGTVAELVGHGHTSQRLVFSPDGQFLAAWSDGPAVVKIWDVDRGSLVSTMTDVGVMKGGLTFKFSPDGRRLLSFGHGHYTKLWHVQGGEPLLRCAENHLISAFAPNSQKLALYDYDSGMINVRNGVTGEPLGRHVQAIDPKDKILLFFQKQFLVFSPDSRYLVSVLSDCTLRLWCTEESTCLCILPAFSSDPLSVWYSTGGERLICREESGRVHRFQIDKKDPFLSPLTPPDSLSFADSETSPMFHLEKESRSLYLVSGSGKRSLCCTIPAAFQTHLRPKMKSFGNTVAVVSPDGRALVLRISV